MKTKATHAFWEATGQFFKFLAASLAYSLYRMFRAPFVLILSFTGLLLAFNPLTLLIVGTATLIKLLRQTIRTSKAAQNHSSKWDTASSQTVYPEATTDLIPDLTLLNHPVYQSALATEARYKAAREAARNETARTPTSVSNKRTSFFQTALPSFFDQMPDLFLNRILGYADAKATFQLAKQQAEARGGEEQKLPNETWYVLKSIIGAHAQEIFWALTLGACIAGGAGLYFGLFTSAAFPLIGSLAQLGLFSALSPLAQAAAGGVLAGIGTLIGISLFTTSASALAVHQKAAPPLESLIPEAPHDVSPAAEWHKKNATYFSACSTALLNNIQEIAHADRHSICADLKINLQAEGEEITSIEPWASLRR